MEANLHHQFRSGIEFQSYYKTSYPSSSSGDERHGFVKGSFMFGHRAENAFNTWELDAALDLTACKKIHLYERRLTKQSLNHSYAIIVRKKHGENLDSFAIYTVYYQLCT